MFYRFKYSFLWIFIAVLILSEAFDEDGVCDKDCLISRSDSLSKKRIHRSSSSHTCSFQGIDTSASDGPFQLFGKNNITYDIAYLTRQNGICNCSVVENKHVVVKKELNGKIILTDVYVACGKENANESVLEELIFDYIKNVPERTLGKEPQLKNDDDENCLDEHGFITPKLPGKVPCFSYVSAFSNGTYSSTTNQLLEGNVTYYSGPFSVNRIDQSENLAHNKLNGKHGSMLGLFYELKQTCAHKVNNNNYCHSFFNNATYSIICCCNEKPGQCSFRRYKEKSLICATGSFFMDISNGKEPKSIAPELSILNELKNVSANKTFCSSRYTFDKTSIRYIMPASNFKGCNAGEGDKGYCVLDNDVCPSDEQNPSETSITCCCRKPDLCNVDFVAINAVERFEFMIENKVCDQPMLYSILFARTNYTLEGDDKQPLCYIHYDEQNPDARYFLANNNLDLLRDVDYQAYRKEGCNVIAAKIRLISKDKCPKENYSENDTKLPRPLFLCTCNGTKIETETPPGTKFCDADLKNNINIKYNEMKDKLMPKCFVTKNAFKNFDENVSFDDVLKNGEMKMSTKSVFCYMEVTKESDTNENDTTSNFSLSAGIASLENGYGEKCFNLYQEKQAKDEATEKAFCETPKNDKTFCCMIGMGRKAAELLDEITEKVVEQKANMNVIDYKRSLTCRTSKDTKEFGKECKHPHGCFWTDSSTGEVKTTVVAGCIDTIPKLLEKNSSNPIYRSLQTCVTISKMRRLIKMDEKEKLKEPYRCFATNEINYPDEKDQLTNVFIVCCCTEINENGKCDKNDNSKKSYGAKVIDVGNNKISKQHKNQIYSVPF